MVKRLLYCLCFLFVGKIAAAQDAQGMVVNRFRHTPLLLNTYASALGTINVYEVVSAAYSTRRINLKYSGPLIRVRLSSGTTEYDIPFTSTGDLDTDYLNTVIPTGTGLIVKWYDQSGNGRDVTPAAISTTRAPRIVSSGNITRKGTNNRPAVIFTATTNALYYTTASVQAQVVNAVRDLIGASYQYLFSMPADADYSVRAGGMYSATTGGGYSDGPNTEDWWYSGSMYVNNTAISGGTSGAVSALHTLNSVGSSPVSGTFSISNNGTGAWSGRGMYNNDGVCELILFTTSAGMTSTIRGLIQANQKAYYGTP